MSDDPSQDIDADKNQQLSTIILISCIIHAAFTAIAMFDRGVHQPVLNVNVSIT